MIRKPPADWQRDESRVLKTARTAAGLAKGGAKAVRTGGNMARGAFCFFFAILWGFAALAGGLAGSLPTFIGVGAMAAFMAWCGFRAFGAGRPSNQLAFQSAAPTVRAPSSQTTSLPPQFADRLKRYSMPAPAEQRAAYAPPVPLSPPVPSGPAMRDERSQILAASRQAIVFRQHFPPLHHNSELSFFGGMPIAPRGFSWPRSHDGGAGSKPFSFLMQIDCAAVPEPARLGLLPETGVLYFFLDLTWGEPDLFRVLYAEGPPGAWAAVPPPDDLGAAYGDDAVHVWKWTHSARECPKLLPKWPFQPVMIDVPPAPRDEAEQEEDGDAPVLWHGGTAMAEALERAQGEEVASAWFSIEDFISADGGMIRPFTHYPHDWRAVEIASGLLLDRLRHKHGIPGAAALRSLSEEQRTALFGKLRDEAEGWFRHAASQHPYAAVPQSESDRFWDWLAERAWLVRFVISEAMTLSIEASLAYSPEAAARIPADVARRVHGRHTLASRSKHGLFATTPGRMLAPPVDVQGHQWERAKTHLLLLELSSNEGLGHHFGEGVYQFWITPENLKARRFDKVELTADAY